MPYNEDQAPPAGERFDDVFPPSQDEPADFSDVESGSSSTGGKPRTPREQRENSRNEALHSGFQGIARAPGYLIDMAGRLVRGAPNMAQSRDEVKAEGGKTAEDPTWVGELNDEVFGKPRDDIAKTTELVIGMGLTYAAAVPLTGGAAVTGLLPALGRGAITAFVGQNPYESNLSELLTTVARENDMPGLASLAETLNVDEDDSEFEARLKRAAADLPLTGLFEVGVPLFRAAKALKIGNGKLAMEELKKVHAYSSAPQPKAGPAQVRAEPDGQYSVHTPDAPASVEIPGVAAEVDVTSIAGVTKTEAGYEVKGYRGVASETKHPLEPGLEGATFVSPDEGIAQRYATDEGRKVGQVSEISATVKNPLIIDEPHLDPRWKTMDQADILKQAQADGHDAVIFKKFHKGADEVALLDQNTASVGAQRSSESITFPTRAEAEVTADALNAKHADELVGQAHPSTLSPDETEAFTAMAQRLQAATDPAELEAILTGSRLNLARHRAPQGTLAVLEAGNRILLAAIEKNPVALEVTERLGRETYAAAQAAGMLEEFLKHNPDVTQQHIYGTAVRIGMHEQGRSAASAISRWEGTRTAADYETLEKAVENLKGFMLRDDQMATAQGRGLGARTIDIGTDGMPRPVAEATVKQGDKVKPIDLAGQKKAADVEKATSPKAVKSLEEKVKKVREARTKIPKDPREELKKLLGEADAELDAAFGRITEEVDGAGVKTKPAQKPKSNTQKIATTGSDVALAKYVTVLENLEAALKGPEMPVLMSAEEEATKGLAQAVDRAGKVAESADVGRDFGVDELLDRIARAKEALKGTKKADGDVVDLVASAIQDSENVIKKASAKQKQLVSGVRPTKTVGEIVTPVDRLKTAEPTKVLGQTPREVITIARAARLADGNITNLYRVARLAKEITKNPNLIQQASNWFVAGLLAHPTTMMMPIISGFPTTVFTGVRQTLAGGLHAARTGELALMREGVDFTSYALSRKGIGEAIQAGKLSFKAGRSIMDPRPVVHNMEPGMARTATEMAPRVMSAGDEMVKMLNYRAEVVAKSLRANRGRLSGQELLTQVEKDLVAAFDPKTGIALLPETLERATVPGFSGALLPGSVSERVHSLVNSLDAKGSKFFAPFIRASAHTFNFVVDHTPALGLALQNNRAALDAGGEAAAGVWAKQAMGGALMASGYMAVKEGLITGRAPADPKLRAIWLENHQEYSVRTPAGWVSYRRVQPFASILSLATDVGTLVQDENISTDDIGGAVAAVGTSLAQVFTSQTYAAPMFDIFGAIFKGDHETVARWFKNTAATLAVPRVFASANTDPTIHEAQGIVDAVLARTAWSETVPTKRNFLGEPLMRGFGDNLGGFPQAAQQLFNPFPIKPIKDDGLTKELERVRFGATPPSPRESDLMNFKDERHAKDGVTPYAAWMDYVRSGWEGKPSLREELAAYVKTAEYKGLSETGAEYGQAGGAKVAQLQAVVRQYYGEAKQRMLQDYPEVQEKIDAGKTMKFMIRTGDGSSDEIGNFFRAAK